MGTYIAGDVARTGATFTDTTTNTLIDPTTVMLVYRPGGGAAVPWTYGEAGSPIVRDSLGTYHADLDTTGLPGTWTYEWVSKGSGQGIAVNAFLVTSPPIVPQFPT